jgi:hypothetical protein
VPSSIIPGDSSYQLLKPYIHANNAYTVFTMQILTSANLA